MAKTYETYKDSGIAWIGEIPSEWSIEKGKHVLRVLSKPVQECDEVITCFRDGEVILRSLRRTEGFTMSDKEIGYQHIDRGDIVIHGMDGFAGSMGISKSTGKGSPVLIVCNTIKDNPNYLMYYLRILASTNVFLALSTGIRERSCDLKWNKISVLPFAIPPLSDQQSIATFLDTKCGEIDALISLQEEMISELQAYKQSVITEAATKGLNPHAKMKDSGVEWIGEIPEGWKVCRLKNNVSLINVTSTSTNKIGLENIESGTGKFRQTSSEFEGNGIEFVENDIVYGKLRPYLQKVWKATFKGNAVGDFFVFRVNTATDSDFVKYLFLSDGFTKEVVGSTFGAKMPRVSSEFILTMNRAFPPLPEQHSIATYLDEKTSQIDSLISLKQEKIQELKDYKKSIIYEYVTGKKRV